MTVNTLLPFDHNTRFIDYACKKSRVLPPFPSPVSEYLLCPHCGDHFTERTLDAYIDHALTNHSNPLREWTPL